MVETISILVALALLGWFSFGISKWLQAWTLRRKIKRLKADFAKLQGAVLHVEQMKSVVTHWNSKNTGAKHEQDRKT